MGRRLIPFDAALLVRSGLSNDFVRRAGKLGSDDTSRHNVSPKV